MLILDHFLSIIFKSSIDSIVMLLSSIRAQALRLLINHKSVLNSYDYPSTESKISASLVKAIPIHWDERTSFYIGRPIKFGTLLKSANVLMTWIFAYGFVHSVSIKIINKAVVCDFIPMQTKKISRQNNRFFIEENDYSISYVWSKPKIR